MNMDDKGPTISAQDARQGETVLRARRSRIIFIAGLIGIVVLAFLLQLVTRMGRG